MNIQLKLVSLFFPKVYSFIIGLTEENVQYHKELIRKANECDSLDTTLAHKEEQIEDFELKIESLEDNLEVELERNGLLELENYELLNELDHLKFRYMIED